MPLLAFVVLTRHERKPGEFLDAEHDRCFCPSCAADMPAVIERDGESGSAYEVPTGWCGFGLIVPPRAHSLQVFNQWAVSYHGCPLQAVPHIMREGQLLKPGDYMIDGSKLRNHATGKALPLPPCALLFFPCHCTSLVGSPWPLGGPRITLEISG
jgi:hypothetical protein